MLLMLTVAPHAKCGASYRIAECYYCVLQRNCESARNVEALWVPYTQRA